MTLHVVEHPLVAHYLTRLRDRDTTPDEFREASDKIITLLLYEATRDLRTRDFSVDTPLEKTQGHAIGDRVVAVPILRAGLGLVGPVLELLPHVTVGYIGLERDERTAIASSPGSLTTVRIEPPRRLRRAQMTKIVDDSMSLQSTRARCQTLSAPSNSSRRGIRVACRSA